MNERIKLLAEQCWINDGGPDSYFSKEKFAELIVQECVEVSKNARSLEAAAMITMHFGLNHEH